MKMLIVYLAFAAGALLAYTAMTPAVPGPVARRLAEIRRGGGRPAVDPELAEPFTQRVLLPMWQRLLSALAALLPRAVQERARQRLAQAGVQMDPSRFVGFSLVVAAGGGILPWLLMVPVATTGRWLPVAVLSAVGGAAGWRLPTFWLLRRATERKQALSRALPEVMDVLCVSVEAGLGFDGAIQEVAERFPEPVAGEFREYLKEVRLGRTRTAALHTLAERWGVEELRSFVAAVVQADQLGVSMARVLRAQSDAMRTRRRQRAEERAMQLPLKMLFPLIFFIFPALFVVVLGPMLIQFLTIFRG